MIRCTASGAVHARIKELDILSQTSLMTRDLSKRETKAVVFTFLECALCSQYHQYGVSLGEDGD